MPVQTQPKIIDLRRNFDQNQCWESMQPFGSEILELRRNFERSMDQRDYAEAVNISLPLAIATNEISDRDRLEKALNALRLADFVAFEDAILEHDDLWAIAKELSADEPLRISLKILNEIDDFTAKHQAQKDVCINKNDLLGLLDTFRFDSYCSPKLPLWNQESDVKLLVRENKKLVNRGAGAPLGLGWWIAFSRMFHRLPTGSTIACPAPLTTLFELNFPSLIFTQEYSDREFLHEVDPLILPSIFGCLPKEKYFNYPELKPIQGKVGFALGDRKRIQGKDVINNLPLDFEDVWDLEDADLIAKGFVSTAKEIASCSFVIGADCPVIHLAGTMGVPSAIILTKTHDARFGMAESGDRISWYDCQRVIKSFN